MPDSIRVNGNLKSYGSIQVKVANELFTGFTSIKYGDKRERAYGYGQGAGHAPRGITRGKYVPEPTVISGHKDSIQALRETLAGLSSDGRSYGNAVFQIVVQYVENDDSDMTVELEDNRLTSDVSSDEENPDPLTDEIECMPMRIRRNGLTLWDSSSEG